LDRRTNTSDGSGGATPTVVTAQHDDNDLTAEDDQPTQILGTRSVRTAATPARAATTKPAPGKEASANGTSAADGSEAAEADVPALPADSIRSTRDPSTSSRPASAPASPGADDLMPSDNGTSPAAEAEPAEPSGGAEAGAVSAAAFVWDPPEPAPTSPSSPARNFLRSSASTKASASQRTPPVSVGPAKAGSAAAGPALARDARPKRSARRSARQAHLTVARIEPWSVMKFSFVVSLVAFVILFVAVSVIYGTLSALGVFTSLQHVVQSVTSSQDSNGVNAATWFTASRILSYTAMLGALNIVLITAMCTIGAVAYNLTSRLVGGVEVTLRETE